ncbi:tRNA pseudouridine(38-40) synthase TruA [Acetivibrio mesophilus]|uniref:tRNA pseudouridine synthase A n=1 Tax=Acetivibrio mesophilus TaxID=2487273 RepID=A0A4Q0I6S4_9FIRM|nr:tRNA pseudouridine(38-40) synthase TruA [Acetivibrio mesophilus]ODM25871.1 tRNA pseudouridine(38,39,40) synthase TruA [Clostridium sp. Bc-iso-3]RXE59545.1 tRNA pseudouridine(38-40) synthase TruA [Acetivibrio mesophilus]HHV30754.1 tRNA pseudouridine(38-40) synthase TruA [Clostridium sp.]
MKNMKMILQYDGSRYQGWQRLGDSDRTIQGKIEKVLSVMTGEDIEVIGSGRTDAGVHAIRQVANFHTESSMVPEAMLDYCYRYLPEDIVVLDMQEVDKMFHSRYNAKAKKYLYRIWNDRFHNPFYRKYACHIPNCLDIDSMRQAARFLIGEHDYTSFTTLKSKKKSKVRRVYSIDIEIKDKIIDIIFYGNGFLYNMVRIMTGTLIEVGLGKISPDAMENILSGKDRSLAGYTAPSNGLFLYEVEY